MTNISKEDPLARIFAHIPLLFSLQIAFISWPLLAQTGDAPAPTNVEMFGRLARMIVLNVAESAKVFPGDTCVIAIRASDQLEFISHFVLDGFRTVPVTVVGNPEVAASSKAIELQLVSASVSYGRPFRRSLLGEKRLGRTVTLGFSGKVTEVSSGELGFAGLITRSLHDTVDVAQLDRIESPAIPATRGEVPTESLFDRFLEPAVIIGATGVIVYLLFTVRS